MYKRQEWEYTRRLEVEAKAKSRIGYVHLRAMGGDNIAEWAREFYPVYNREGLIIDVRHNRGGNIESWLISRLMRKPWMWWAPRNGDPTPNMQNPFRGHLVVLDRGFGAGMDSVFLDDLRYAKEIKLDEFRKRSRWEKTLERVSSLISRLL